MLSTCISVLLSARVTCGTSRTGGLSEKKKKEGERDRVTGKVKEEWLHGQVDAI